jgi:DNA-binding IclR family transcriptional regulator
VLTNTRLEVLKLLKLRDDSENAALAELDELAQALGRSKRETRDLCTTLEVEGLVEAAHSMGGDQNPSYWITPAGIRIVVLSKETNS